MGLLYSVLKLCNRTRQTIKDIEVNVAYRWFLGLTLEDKVPHFTTYGK
ncbi:transposase, partial [Streptococcus dysgalactiae]